jgi:protein-S-isoprenylcysteine O-methyltransferase Ste14
MELIVYRLALGFVALAALGRVTGIFALKLFRQTRYSRDAVAYPTSWRDRCTVPEPPLLGATTLLLVLWHRVPVELSAAVLARTAAATLLALLAVILMLWALRAFPGVSTGHYVLPNQRLVSSGPYGLVRHPLYLAAFFVWLAVALAFASPAALAITALYVIPGYVIYIRSEEEMLLTHLGEPYRRYRDEVGMLLPRLRLLRRPSRLRGA